jgi:hypothetical protein
LSLKEVFAMVFGLWNRQNVVALDVSRLRVSLIEFKFEFVSWILWGVRDKVYDLIMT